jgi:hypothetical protein
MARLRYVEKKSVRSLGSGKQYTYRNIPVKIQKRLQCNPDKKHSRVQEFQTFHAEKHFKRVGLKQCIIAVSSKNIHNTYELEYLIKKLE